MPVQYLNIYLIGFLGSVLAVIVGIGFSDYGMSECMGAAYCMHHNFRRRHRHSAHIYEMLSMRAKTSPEQLVQ